MALCFCVPPNEATRGIISFLHSKLKRIRPAPEVCLPRPSADRRGRLIGKLVRVDVRIDRVIGKFRRVTWGG